MNPTEAIARFKTLGAALRPGIILVVAVGGGAMIGRKYDAPVEGLAVGIGVAALVNGALDYAMIRNATVTQ